MNQPIAPATVQQAVQAVPGVDSVRVNLTMKRVSVEASPDVTAPQLIEVLKGVGPFGLEDMATASFSLSELADRFRESGRCELAPVQVHVQSLRLLLATGEQLPAAARAEILKGLDGVLARAPRARVED